MKRDLKPMLPLIFLIFWWASVDAENIDDDQPMISPKHHFRFEHYLGEANVFRIVQDKKGFMWFAAVDGLYRYDGYEFVVYRHDPDNPYSLVGNLVEFVFEDREGVLWVATDGGLNQYDRAHDRFISYQHDPDNPQSLSHNFLIVIYEDRAGMLWIGTFKGGLNMFDRTTQAFTRYLPDPKNPYSLKGDYVRVIYEDKAGMLWVGTNEGLNRFDPETKRFTHYQHDPGNPESLSHSFVESIHEDAFGDFWVGTRSGFNWFDRKQEKSIRYLHDPNDPFSLGDNDIRVFYEDSKGVFWIGTLDGLNTFDRTTGQFVTYRSDPNDPYSLSGNEMQSICEDRTGALWVGTYGRGVNRLDPESAKWTVYQNDSSDPDSLSDGNVQSIHENASGMLWIGTAGGGLNQFDPVTRKSIRYQNDPGDPKSLSSNLIYAVHEDYIGGFWVGTTARGLSHLDSRTSQFKHYQHDSNDPTSLGNNDIRALLMDSTRTLWVGTFGAGLNRFVQESETFVRYMTDDDVEDSLSSNRLLSILEDQKGRIWVGTYFGLNRLDRKTETFARYHHDPKNPKTISNDTIYCLYESPAGTLWIGTAGGLNKLDMDTGTINHYVRKDGLPVDVIRSILEDDKGNLWLGTMGGGLVRFDPLKETFKTYTKQDGLPNNQFIHNAAFKNRQGRLYFGGPNGVLAFYPDQLMDNPHPPEVVFTDFLIFNQPVIPEKKNSSLQRVIGETNAITLTYAQSVFSFEFSALNYHIPEKNRYAYKMEGFEKEWNHVDSRRRFATYTNLDPGSYRFRVKASNNDGLWNEKGTSVQITITPPWWQTHWFRLSFSMLVIGLLIAGYRIRVRSIAKRNRELENQVLLRTDELTASNIALHKAREIAESERKTAETANQAKSIFLANMSHELRTPLNSVLGFAQIMQNDSVITPTQHENLDIIRGSGEHLLALINDVLDVSRIEAGRMSLHLKSFDLPGLIDYVAEVIRVRCADKGLDFKLQADSHLPRFIETDPVKLRQLLFNLLGNAVKFTPTGGITLRVHLTSRDGKRGGALKSDTGISIGFEVEDTGVGLSGKDCEKIFEPFVQIDRSQAVSKGVGLGLAICRQYVDLMGGALHVESTHGKGSLFYFHVRVKAMRAGDVSKAGIAFQGIIGLAEGTPTYRILIVEDQPENCLLLKKMLLPIGFEVKEAVNGKEAVDLFNAFQPHFIWMDIRMPVMDGLEATRRIKAKAAEAGQRIIISALTAHALDQERAVIMAAGCDDMVRKPYREEEIFKIMARHLELKYRYSEKEITKIVAGPDEKLVPEKLAGLPADFRKQLYEAALKLNTEKMEAVIHGIMKTDPSTGNQLKGLVDNFDYKTILDLLESENDDTGGIA